MASGVTRSMKLRSVDASSFAPLTKSMLVSARARLANEAFDPCRRVIHLVPREVLRRVLWRVVPRRSTAGEEEERDLALPERIVVGERRDDLGVHAADDEPLFAAREIVDDLGGAFAPLRPERKERASHVVRQALGTERVPDEIHAHHHVDPIDRWADLGGSLRVVRRSHLAREEVGRLLCVERREDDAASVRALRLQATAHLDEDRHRGGVVIGAWIEAGRVAAEMIVMRGDEHPSVHVPWQRRDEVRATRTRDRLLRRIEPHVAERVTHEAARANSSGRTGRAPRACRRTKLMDEVSRDHGGFAMMRT